MTILKYNKVKDWVLKDGELVVLAYIVIPCTKLISFSDLHLFSKGNELLSNDLLFWMIVKLWEIITNSKKYFTCWKMLHSKFIQNLKNIDSKMF